MDKYYDYIKNKFNECLIKTFPISIHEKEVRNRLEFITNNYLLDIDYINDKFKIEIYDNFDKINSIFNILGYFISKFMILFNYRILK